jgi:hypothetical protein
MKSKPVQDLIKLLVDRKISITSTLAVNEPDPGRGFSREFADAGLAGGDGIQERCRLRFSKAASIHPGPSRGALIERRVDTAIVGEYLVRRVETAHS